MTSDSLNSSNSFNSFNTTPRKTLLDTVVEAIFGRATPEPLTAANPYANEPEVAVAAPIEGQSPISSLREAMTSATAKFAARNVAPIYEDDNTQAFKVRELKIEFKNAPPQFLREIEALQPEVLNRIAKARMQKAHGAAELLMLDDFFGATLVADINNVVGGYMVDTAVAYSGGRFCLNFAFVGDYDTRPAPHIPHVPPTTAPIAHETIYPLRASAPAAAPQTKPNGFIPGGKDTPLPPAQGASPGKDTPVFPPSKPVAPSAVAKLHLRSGSDVATVLLQADNFPYTLGRHESFVGYSVKGRRDASAEQFFAEEPVGFVSYASRNHLALDSFDAGAQQFCVVAEKGKNGSYFKGSALPGRFLLPIAQMAKGDWLKLGGVSGDGILEIRIEAP